MIFLTRVTTVTETDKVEKSLNGEGVLSFLIKTIMKHDEKIKGNEQSIQNLFDLNLQQDWTHMRSKAITDYLEKDVVENAKKFGNLKAEIHGIQYDINEKLTKKIKRLYWIFGISATLDGLLLLTVLLK